MPLQHAPVVLYPPEHFSGGWIDGHDVRLDKDGTVKVQLHFLETMLAHGFSYADKQPASALDLAPPGFSELKVSDIVDARRADVLGQLAKLSTADLEALLTRHFHLAEDAAEGKDEAKLGEPSGGEASEKKMAAFDPALITKADIYRLKRAQLFAVLAVRGGSCPLPCTNDAVRAAALKTFEQD
jgi:hypothetical protein